MIKVSKERLLNYFPHRIEGQNVSKNETVREALLHINNIISQGLNKDRISDINLEIKMIDLQSDISQRIERFNEAQKEFPEVLEDKRKAYQKEAQSIAGEHVPDDIRQNFPNGGYSYSIADDPEAFEEEMEQAKEEYSEVFDKIEEIEEDFQDKMKGISSVKFTSVDPFEPEDIRSVQGELKKVVRVLLESDE